MTSFWEDLKSEAKKALEAAWEDIKDEAKQIGKESWEEAKREWRKANQPLPAAIKKILDSTPQDQVPEIPLFLDDWTSAIFLDRPLAPSDFDRGWIPITIWGREVRIVLTDYDRKLWQAMMVGLKEIEEKRRRAPVPRRVQVILDSTPADQELTINFTDDLKIFIDPDQDLEGAVRRGFLYATIKGRRVRLDLRSFLSQFET